MKKPAVLGMLLVGASACQDATSPRPVASIPSGLTAAAAASANDYVVTFHDDERDPPGHARALVAAHGGSLKFVYRSALKGFSVAGLPDAAVEALKRNPRVAAIERDQIMSVVSSGEQTGATWGIDRIDQRNRPLDGKYVYGADGSDVTAYIIDTGIFTSHTEFGGRATEGYTAINDGLGATDCHGHGTHVAGTVGGSTYGVAKGVDLVAVRVLGCNGSGSTSGVIAGVDWVKENHAPNSVANMSLGGGFSSALNTAVSNAVLAGVTFAVAAGNENSDACFRSPASAANVLTVGSTTSTDAKSSFSNWGTCVEINAPGSSITSAYITSNTATATMSGTSMASPHVAGAAAAYLSATTNKTPADVATALMDNATSGVLTGLTGETPNKLLYVGFIGGGSTPPDGGTPPPVSVSFTVSCSNFECIFDATDGFATYTWTFGDGDGASGSNDVATNQYPVKGGSYTVTLTVSGGASAERTVSCNPKRGCRLG